MNCLRLQQPEVGSSVDGLSRNVKKTALIKIALAEAVRNPKAIHKRIRKEQLIELAELETKKRDRLSGRPHMFLAID